MLSKSAKYALRAALYLGRHAGRDNLATVDELSEALDLPRNYLSKILHTLGRWDVVSSTPGPKGGFRLSDAPEEVPLRRVIEPFDELDGEQRCLLGYENCSDEDACPMHSEWKGVADRLVTFFEGTTVADVLESEAPVPEL